MNQQGIFSGLLDTPLTEEGKKQCHQAAKSLKNVRIDAIVCSPMKRTVDSANIVAEEIGFPLDKIIISELFVERSFGPLEGTEYTQSRDLDKTNGVEHSNTLIKRARLGLELINSLPADTVLIVSHGAVGRALKHVIDPSIDYHQVEGFNNAKIIKLI